MSAAQVSGRGLGYKPDPRKLLGEKPDIPYAFRAVPVPKFLSLRMQVVEVLNQLSLGSCVAHACSQQLRCELIKTSIGRPPLPSRLGGYNLARAKDGTLDQDAGTFLRSFYEVTNQFGFAPEELFPYSDDDERFKEQPPEAYLQAAYDQKGGKPSVVYRRITETGTDRGAAIKQAIAAKHTVAFGTDVSQAFVDSSGKGIWRPPTGGETIAGGHAMLIVGYDRDTFEICNSWGTDFGDEGFILFSRSYLEWPATNDLWVAEHVPEYSA